MTVPAQTSTRTTAVGNGITTVFAFDFLCLESRDLRVSVADAVVDPSQYTVTGLGQHQGGQVIFLVAPAGGDQILLELAVVADRQNDYQEYGDLFAKSVNFDLDRLWLAVQGAVGNLRRALQLGTYDQDGSGAYRANGNRIQNVGKPKVTTDAARQQDIIEALSGLAADGSGQFVVERLADANDSENGASMVANASQVVDSITKLRSLRKSSPSKFARTTGYHAPEDGGAAFYYLDESDTTSADNGVTVIVASDGGRWKLNHNGSINVRQAGARGDGSDDIVALQRATDALSPGLRLVAEGEFTTSEELWIRKSNVVYDFRAAKFIQTGTTYTGYGSGLIIGNLQTPSDVPTNVTLLGGEYHPVGNSQPYPLADYNSIAVIAGNHITIVNPRIYPKQSTRAISVQTDSSFWSEPGPAIDGVYVYGLEVYGDGDAVDGVDITSDGRDDLIRNVYVQGQVFGCKQGFNVSPGSDSYNFRGINIDLIVDGATERAGNVSRCINSNISLVATNSRKTGLEARQMTGSIIRAKIHGAGGDLLNAFALVDGIGTAQNTIDINASGPWAIGVYAGSEFAVYRNVEVDGAALGIKTLGFRTTWNDVVLRNCTVDIDNPHLPTDVWGSVVTQKTGDSPRKRGMTIGANNGVDQFYSLDLAGGETIVIPAGSAALPLGNVATFSGMLLVNGVGGIGDPGLFLAGGLLTYFLGGSSASFSDDEGSSGTVNVYYNADSVIEIKNNTASTVTLRVMSIRMRSSP